MTTLNTIIEEDKNVELLKRYIREAYPQGDALIGLVDDILTTSMQRAYEAGQEAHKKEMEEAVKVGVDLTMNAMIKNSSGFDTINGRRIWHVDLDALQDSLTPTKEVTEELTN